MGLTGHSWSTVQGKRWSALDAPRQKAYVMRLLDGLEVVSRDQRLKVARAILYLAQGTGRNQGQATGQYKEDVFLIFMDSS